MLIALAIIGVWFFGIISFIAYDAFFGFGFEFDGHDLPPLGVPAVFWPIAVPILLFCALIDFFDKVKTNRKIKEENVRKIRISTQQELDKYMAEAEQEVKKILSNSAR